MSSPTDSYEDILYESSDGVLLLTINRPDNGNMLREQTCLELFEALRAFRKDRELGVAILTGAGDRFFCIGGEHESTETIDYSSVLPIVDVYEMIDTVPKPIIAAVNGFAVGGGNVLHNICDLSIASDRAVFRQVGPLVGSFDAGYGTWYLEETIGRKRAKELWYLNRRYSAEDALRLGLVNEVVVHDELMTRTREIAIELLDRGPGAIAGLKAAFSSRHTGVVGQARVAHDQLLTQYLMTNEAHALSESFKQRQPVDRSKFGS
jgi:naphthoate synthase